MPDAATIAQRTLGQVAGGRLARLPVTLAFWDGSRLRSPEEGAPTMLVRNSSAVVHLLHAPSQLGLARAWVAGALDVDDELEAVLARRGRFRGLRLSPADRARVALVALRLGGPGVLRRPAAPAVEAAPRGRRHSLARDRDAIHHHYDVSNRFYELLLGPSMVYSCAYFTDRGESLEAAQARKLELICRKLRTTTGERLLDIGCGWGSLVLHAAARHGVRALGITLSAAQADYANERIRSAGLAGRAEVRVADYRELRDKRFDKIASVGMYEHVGRAELDGYIARVRALLRPGGLFLNHGVARLHSDPPDGDTFISRYVFPDGELHPLTDLMAAMRRASMEVRDVESLRDHYPTTLRRWAANLAAHRAAAIAEVGEERERVWRLYTLASAQAFEAGEIAVYQVLAARSGAPHGLPLTRRWLLAEPAAGRHGGRPRRGPVEASHRA